MFFGKGCGPAIFGNNTRKDVSAKGRWGFAPNPTRVVTTLDPHLRKQLHETNKQVPAAAKEDGQIDAAVLLARRLKDA